MFVRAKQNWFRRVAFAGAVLATAVVTLGATPQPAAAQYYRHGIPRLWIWLSGYPYPILSVLLSLLRLRLPLVGLAVGVGLGLGLGRLVAVVAAGLGPRWLGPRRLGPRGLGRWTRRLGRRSRRRVWAAAVTAGEAVTADLGACTRAWTGKSSRRNSTMSWRTRRSRSCRTIIGARFATITTCRTAAASSSPPTG